jgi:pyruvate formate-lyase activating enzyme-like uncharacterized protein
MRPRGKMKIIPIQEMYQRKFDRQKKIKELSYHAAGHCVHLGKISPGCYGCFVPDPYKINIYTGAKCTLDCIYCSQGKTVRGEKIMTSEPPTRFKNKKTPGVKERYLIYSCRPDYHPSSISYSGGGDPLLHIDDIAQSMRFFHDLHKKLEKKPWYFLYTNGVMASKNILLQVKDLGFDEIRFHLGASNFSKKVYKHMDIAIKYFKTISVETPAWPYHRKKLFDMLPKIDDIGVKHLNIGEVEINEKNFKRISAVLPEGEICQCGGLQLYDGGLVYDIIEEVVRKKYSYSVLDCNCFVKNIQRASGKWVFHEEVEGLCVEY